MRDAIRLLLYPRSRPNVPKIIRVLPLLIALSLVPAALAQRQPESVPGVKNFGRVTDLYFRGGSVTPDGVAELHKRGVRTIIDLRDTPSPGEPDACERLGIRYLKYPLSGHESPDPRIVDEILSIISTATEPVYVHCSAGKHRAGTICAMYRMKVQGWTKEQAWDEQKSYGFGAPEEHPQLFAFAYDRQIEPVRGYMTSSVGRVYGPKPQSTQSNNSNSKSAETELSTNQKVASDDDDDDDESEDGDDSHHCKDKKKKHKSEHKKHKHDDDRDDRSEQSEDVTTTEPAIVAPRPDPVGLPKSSAASPSNNVDLGMASLNPAEPYLPLRTIIDRARAHGGLGDVVKVDLEYDTLRSIVTWDVTFSSGLEVEADALSGTVLGTKQKPAAKMAILTPIAIEHPSTHQILSFQDIIARAHKREGKPVTEMELKKIKGRDETMYEVVFSDGTTVYFDAFSGGEIPGL